MRPPLVSLLVPVFNRHDLLRDCLVSALGQSFTDFELVVSDNASTDETWSVCQEFEALDHRVRAVRNDENIGPARNWRRLVDEARGQYSKLLFSDDLLARNYLETALVAIQDPDVAFAFCTAEIGPAPGQGRLAYRHFRRSRKVPSAAFINASLMAPGSLPVSPGSALFRTQDLRESLQLDSTGPHLETCLATGAGLDQLTLLLTALRYPWVSYIHEPLAFFRSHPSSITIDGAGGLVRDCYLRAAGWFADHHTRGFRRMAILSMVWWRAARKPGHWQRPRPILRQYSTWDGSESLLMLTGICMAVARRLWSASGVVRSR